MIENFTHRGSREIAHPQRRLFKGQLYYFASSAELADPEWVSKFRLNNPRVKLVENKTITFK